MAVMRAFNTSKDAGSIYFVNPTGPVALMRHLECLGDPLRDSEHLAKRHRALRDTVGQCRALTTSSITSAVMPASRSTP